MDLRLNWLAWSLVLALAVAQEGLNYETDLTMWIDPRCQEGIVQSFNEVRFGYQQLRRALHETPVPKWLNEATNRWFGFDTTESEYMEYLDKTILRMASLIRVDDIAASRYGLYCGSGSTDNHEGPGYKLLQDTLIYHEPSGNLWPLGDPPCHTIAEAITINNWRDVRKYRLPDVELPDGQETAVHVRRSQPTIARSVTLTLQWCVPKDEQDYPYTIREAAKRDLQGYAIVKVKTSTRVMAHEFAHVYELSTLKLNFGEGPKNPTYGMDDHKVFNGETEVDERNGYYHMVNIDVAGKILTPSEDLVYPEFTLLNPDSYAWFLVEFLQHERNWEIYVGKDKNLRYRKGPLTEEQVKALPSWPTGEPPNWSDRVTPMVKLPGSLIVPVG